MAIEDAFKQLDEIIEILENKDTSLSEAFSQYEKGIRLVNECNKTLDKVEKDIIVLQEGVTDDENTD